MEREVADTEGVFSRNLSSNWAELPTTLRRRQKHRPEILSQFTDYSESSESEFRRIEPKPFSYIKGFAGRPAGIPRKFELNDFSRRDEESRKENKNERKIVGSVEDDYRKHYENYDSKVNQQKGNFRSYSSRFDKEFKSVSDEDRKTNSPDSLLVKSSDSETSSDEYGHTDDSGAFLEKSSVFDKVPRPKYDSVIESSSQSRFIRFFSKEDAKKKPEPKSPTLLDVNKNVKRQTKITNTKDALQQRFDYENIPRIDVTKLDQKSFLNPLSQITTGGKNPGLFINRKQPTIDQLRQEEGFVRGPGARSPNNNDNINNNNNNITADNNVSRITSRVASPPQKQPTIEELRIEGLIKDFYDSEQLAAKSCGDRKLSKMETIAEENADGSKLSVREILKRFEELRSQNELQSEDKVNNDKTLSTIQETLRKLDEKVKSYQVEITTLFSIIFL